MEVAFHIFAIFYSLEASYEVEPTLKRRGVHKCQGVPETMKPETRVLEWVAIAFSRGSSRSGNRTWVSCIADRFFILRVPGGAPVAGDFR